MKVWPLQTIIFVLLQFEPDMRRWQLQCCWKSEIIHLDKAVNEHDVANNIWTSLGTKWMRLWANKTWYQLGTHTYLRTHSKDTVYKSRVAACGSKVPLQEKMFPMTKQEKFHRWSCKAIGRLHAPTSSWFPPSQQPLPTCKSLGPHVERALQCYISPEFKEIPAQVSMSPRRHS